MGASPQPLLPPDLKGMVLENKGSSPSCGKVLEAQPMRRRKGRGQRINGGHGWSMRPIRILRKRRALLEGSRRPTNGIGKRVRTLKKLVPNAMSMGLNGLFRETAYYILALEMRVKVMKIMVKGHGLFLIPGPVHDQAGQAWGTLKKSDPGLIIHQFNPSQHSGPGLAHSQSGLESGYLSLAFTCTKICCPSPA
ncbi:hypothetical protein HHK36_012230 [Tetracentron sinense]|uniref:Uncharacterized protein n=1 Tax=Tetracentron sinense TaxID=13715 RepID=A0A835DHW7_TETSI|nr:hypothetical protein HHK36_012230 [Tetracentron sinense]